MEAKEQIEKLNKQMLKAIQDKEQALHRLSLAESRAKYLKRKTSPEYRARTHRLCDKGGSIEHFYPDTKDMMPDEFYKLIETLDQCKEVREKILEEISKIKSRREVKD